MKIKTKFNLKDECWFMDNNKAVLGIVSCVETFNVGTNKDSVVYKAKNKHNPKTWLQYQYLHEHMIFKTAEELFKSIC